MGMPSPIRRGLLIGMGKPREEPQQAHRIEIEDGGGGGVVAHLGRVARDHDEVPQPQHPGAEGVGEQADQVPVAATDAGFATIDVIPFNDYCQIVEEAIRAVLAS